MAFFFYALNFPLDLVYMNLSLPKPNFDVVPRYKLRFGVSSGVCSDEILKTGKIEVVH